MAQHVRNGQYEDNGAVETASYIFNPMTYNYQQHHEHPPPTVLSQQDATVMANFFSNPDTTNANDGYLPYGVDARGNFTAGSVAHHSLNDAALLPVESHATYNSHLSQAPRPGFASYDFSSLYMPDNNNNTNNNTNNHNNHNHNQQQTHSAGDAVAGASALLGLSTSQEQAILGANSYMTWRTIVNNHPSTTMARDLPAKSASTSQLQASMPAPPNPGSTWAEIHANEIHMRSRHPSLQLDTNTHFPTHQQAWQNVPASALPHTGSRNRPPMVKFGSDHAFNEHGFTGPADNTEEKHNNMVHMAAAGDLAIDAQHYKTAQQYSHRHSISGMPVQHSPVIATPIQQLQNPQASVSMSSDSGNARKRALHQTDNSPDTSPVKKARNSQQTNGDWTTDAADSATATAATTTSTQATTGRRRAAREPKLPRTNLSDSQKRANHIASEQKRRDTMKANFEILSQRVPAVRDGGAMSRSEILYHVASYMEAIQAGNLVMCKLAGITIEQLDNMPDINENGAKVE